MQTLRVESLTVSDLQAFAMHELAEALSEVLHGVAELGRESISARRALADVRISWHRADGRFPDLDEFKAAQEEAKAVCEMLALRRGVLRDIRSILQTQAKSLA